MAFRKQLPLIFLSLFFLPLNALENRPWFFPPWQLYTGGLVEASVFTTVKDGFNPTQYRSNNVWAKAYLFFAISSKNDIQAEIEFLKTSLYPFGFESFVLQLRHQLLNDISGDFLSFDLGANVRFVPHKRLLDVATPYHNLQNFELEASLGKEFSRGEDWFFRTFLFTGFGQANKGYPWVRVAVNLEGKALKQYTFQGFVKGYFGLGDLVFINVKDFDSYAMFRHKNIDVGVSASILFAIWGKLTFSYVHRVFARSFPDGYNSITLFYDLPFSF